MSTEEALLREQDQAVLEALDLPYATSVDGGFVNLVVETFSTAPGLVPPAADLLLRLPFGFPDAAPDMFWMEPAVTLASGAPIPGTESVEGHVGRTWQRWSRHIAQQWRPGIDNLETYLGYVRRCLRQAGGN